MTKAFHNNAVSQTKKLFVYAGKAGDSFDQETIHELRTHFKKIRALLRWQHANKRSYSVFKQIYQQAGKIRDIQVAQEMLKNEVGVPAEFNNWLAGKLSGLKKEWHLKRPKKIEKKLVQQVNNVKFAPHKKFFPRKIVSLQQVADKNVIADTDIHEMRKKIKDIQYASDWWEKNNGSPGTLLQNIPLAELKKIGTQIGTYNDMCTVINLFKIYLATKKEPIAQNNLVNKWQQEKAMFKKYLIEKIRHLSTSVIPQS